MKLFSRLSCTPKLPSAFLQAAGISECGLPQPSAARRVAIRLPGGTADAGAAAAELEEGGGPLGLRHRP